MSQFETQTAVVVWRRSTDGWVCVNGPVSQIPDRDEADYRACMLGLRDYVNKNGFSNVVLGLSGGEGHSTNAQYPGRGRSGGIQESVGDMHL